MKAIINGKIITETAILTDQVLLYDTVIQAVIPRSQFDSSACQAVIDADENFVSPGFINMHIHGCAGYDTMDDTEESIDLISENLPKTGVTAFLPTTMTYDMERIHKVLARIRQAMHKDHGARVLGANMEGPFLHKDYKGAHDEQYLLQPKYALISDFVDVIRLMTVAPELIQESDFITKCKDNNILLSIGHSSSSYQEARQAIEQGFSHITHMYNALPVLNHRKPGVIGAAMDSDVMCELITDNIHVHPAMQRLLFKAKGERQIVLVTDSMRACMLPDGLYDLGGQSVKVHDGTAKLENGVIAGSVLTMNRALKNFQKNVGISLLEAVKLVTANPAKELRLYDKLGSIASGKLADVTIFNNEIEIMATVIHGDLVYQKERK